MTDCLKAVGAAARAAEMQAELLIQADRMGHPSHGLNRLGSNHNGMAGWWASKAADKGLIGMAFTNTSPFMVPTRSKQAFNTGSLMPLGGGEKNSGYKGFGLAAMVELFCGISSGHCFVAVDPESFAPGFGDRLADSMAHWKQLEPVRAELSS
ncbi:Malate dehydrogenase [Operophtera brumata]|uniref:Malate dehydrogenase n=1 Tax=Operophtera brumata TaxID=104452 RepID=A0A0L7KQ99_OPEBR|nr:Malate dehydrogenase [Operophtera brumata]